MRGVGGIDSSALGGLYANVITLKSSSSGIGVNLPGEMLTQNELSIDSNGDIILGKAVSKGSATLKSSSGDININTGMHARDLTLDAQNVNLKGNTGASRNLTIRSNNLVNDTILAAGVNSDFSEAGGGILTLEITNKVTNNDTLFGKSGIKITAQDLSNASVAVILTNDLETNIANGIKNDGEIFADGTTSIDAGDVENNGSIHSGGNLSLSSDTNIDNDEGTIESLGTTQLIAGDDILSNKGIIYSKEAASLESTNFIAQESTTIVEADASFNVSQTTDIGSSLLQSDALTINTQELAAQSSEVTSFGEITLTTNTIEADSSTIASTNNMDITASTSFSNDKSATLYAQGDIAIQAGELSHTDASIMQSGGDTTIEANSIDNTKSTITATNFSSTGDTLINNEGVIYASEDVAANTQTLENQNGLIQADGATTLTATNSLDNIDGEIYANDALSITGGDVTNNEGVIISSEGKTTIASGTIQSNDSTIAGAGVKISATDITADRSTIESSDTLSITATGDVSMDETTLYANSDATLHATGDVSLNDSVVYSETGKTEVSASSLYAQRLLLSGETSTTVTAQGDVNLNEAEVASTGDVTVSSGGTASLDQAKVYSTQNGVTVSSDTLQANDASFNANTTLDVTVTNDLTAKNTAFVANETVSVSAGDTNIDGSTLYSENSSVALSMKNLSAQNALISGETSTTVNAQGNANLDGAEVSATGNVNLTVQGNTSLHNSSIYSVDESVTLQSGTVDGNGTVINAGKQLAMTVAGSTALTNSELIAVESIEVNTGDTTLDGSTLYSQKSSISLTTQNLSAQNALISGETGTTLNAQGDANLDGAEVSATGDVSVTVQGNTLLNESAIYSVEDHVTLQSGSVDGNGTQLSAGKSLTLNTTNSATLTNAELVATENITFSAKDTNLDGSVLYCEDGEITLQSDNLSANDAYIETNNSVSLQSSGNVDLNRATIQGRSLDLTASGDVVANDATLLSDTTVDIAANSLTHSNGYIASEGVMKLTLAEFLRQTNKSNIQSFDALKVTTKDYSTSGDSLLYGQNGVEIDASGTISHTDGSRILSDDTLDIDADTMNQNDALTYGATANTVTAQTYNSDKAVMLGEGNISTGTFNNTGGFASDSSRFSIDASTAINNQALLSVNGNLNLNTITLNNANGEIESGGDLTLNSDTLNLNSGRIFATNDLTLTSKLTGMNSTSKILSGGGMDLTFKGNTSTAGEIISNASGGETTNIKVEGNLNNNAKLNTGAALVLEANAVTNTNRIQSAGNMQATLNGSLNNSHFFTSGGDMDVTATSITNSGGLASADEMTLRTGSISNSQTIYSGRDMNLLVRDSLYNTNEIYSGGSLYVASNESGGRTGSITNSRGDLESYGDMYFYTNTFRNLGSASLNYEKTYYNFITGTNMTEAEMLAWMDERDEPSVLWKRTRSDSVRNRLVEWFEDRDLYDITTEANGGVAPAKNDGHVVFTEFATVVTGGGHTTPAYTISGGNMYINAGTIENKDATVSSGGNMHFDASNVRNVPSSIEVENEEVTHTISWFFKRRDFNHRPRAQVTESSYQRAVTGSTIIESTSQILVGGRFTGNIGNFQNGGGSSLQPNLGTTTDTRTSQTTESQESVSGDTGLTSTADTGDASFFAPNERSGTANSGLNRTDVNTEQDQRETQDASEQEIPDSYLTVKPDLTANIHNPQENITLPDNPYGIFVTSSKPNGPLIEFNPEYTNYNTYVSSNYILEHLGFKGEDVTRRLGDGLYETQLVRDTMMTLTGQRYANDAKSDMGLYVNLMDAGVKLATQVGLQLGVAPSASQLSRANEDFVWLVEQNVGGHTVLVPKVYLAKAYDRPSGGYIHAKEGIDLDVAGMMYNSGTIKTDGDMTLKTGTLVNEWGNIEAAKSVNVDSVSDIANLSGTIKGGSVSLKSREGSVYNITQSGRTTFESQNGSRTKTYEGKTASITATSGRLTVDARKDITNVGADLSGRGGIDLKAGGDVGVYTLAKEDSFIYENATGNGSGEKITQIQSNIDTNGQLNVNAGGNATFQAANINANGANFTAGGKLDFLAAYNVDYRESHSTHEGLLGDNTTDRLDLEKEVVSTTLNTGETSFKAQEVLLQAVKGRISNPKFETSKITLESLNNVSLHTFDETRQGVLTVTTTNKGDHVETIEGTDIIVSGSITVNGQDITNQLYGGRLISQTPEQIKADIEKQLHTIVNQTLKPATQNADGTYSGYDLSVIETLRTQGVDEHWNEQTTQLNQLGQLVVQLVTTLALPGISNALIAEGSALATAMTNSVVIDAAVSSVISQVTSEGLSAVITGELHLDVGEILTNAVKAAVFAGVTSALDTEMFGDVKDAAGKDVVGQNGVLDIDALDYTQKAVRNITLASTSTLIYGGDFKDNVIAAVGDSVAAPAFNYIGHVLTGKEGLNLDPNDLSTQALITTSHALVGGTIAELSGGEFSSGSVATAVGHVVGEYLQNSILDDAINGKLDIDTNNPNAIIAYVNQKKYDAIAIGEAVGGATVLLTQENVSDEELARATAMAGSVVENNGFGIITGLVLAGIALSNYVNAPDVGEVPKEGMPLADLHPVVGSIDMMHSMVESGEISTEAALLALSKKFPGVSSKDLDNMLNKAGDVLGSNKDKVVQLANGQTIVLKKGTNGKLDVGQADVKYMKESGKSGGASSRGESQYDEIPEYIKDNRIPKASETILKNNSYNKTRIKVKGATVYKGKDGNYYHLDTLHAGKGAELEVYNKRGIHIGTADPITGKIDTSTAKPGRKINVK